MSSGIRKNILVIGNNSSFKDALVVLLEDEKFSANSCTMHNYKKEIRQHKPDLVIVDVPYREYEQKIKKITAFIRLDIHLSIPILLTSTDGKIKAKTKAIGANDFLEMPFDFGVLLKRIIHLFSQV